MPDIVNPALVLGHARAWLGTPWQKGAAHRGIGADCVGLLRGLCAELSGKLHPHPTPRRGWSDLPILFDGLAERAVEVDALAPGCLVALKIGRRVAHCGIYSDRGVIHSSERLGVHQSARAADRSIAAVFALQVANGCETGPTDLAIEDCVAVVHECKGGAFYEVADARGTPLARSIPLPSRRAALDVLAPIYTHIETVT